jgi:hypothetical protein
VTLARKTQAELDLSADEQKHVRLAIRHLHVRLGDWMLVARALRYARSTIADMANGLTPVSASVAFRVARFLGASIDDLLAGRVVAPSTCPYCKQPMDHHC